MFCVWQDKIHPAWVSGEIIQYCQEEIPLLVSSLILLVNS